MIFKKFQNAFNPGQFYCGFDRCFKISENERHNLSVMWSCLIAERCTFNVQQHSGLRQKLESILEETVDCNVYSSRVCRPCGRKIESLNKKYQVVIEQIRELRGKYYLACRKSTITVKTSTVKRISNQRFSMSSRKRDKRIVATKKIKQKP